MKAELTYEEFCEKANDEVLEKFYTSYLKAGDDETREQHYYGDVKYWSSQISN